VAEHPILFTGPMVRAILAGTKNQTRRIWSMPKGLVWYHSGPLKGEETGDLCDPVGPGWCTVDEVACRYGRVGDQLWVRETGWERPERTAKMMREGADTWAPYYYDADGITAEEAEQFKAWGFKRNPSIHMPKWACRIRLEITDVRVERLHDLTEQDALAEGIASVRSQVWDMQHFAAWRFKFDQAVAAGQKPPVGPTPAQAFCALWQSINGAKSWAVNPWVWVISFQRIKG
jgi:hypothetical protein